MRVRATLDAEMGPTMMRRAVQWRATTPSPITSGFVAFGKRTFLVSHVLMSP